MKLSDRMDILEKTVMKHLEESGEIRSDLKWLKKAFWVLVGLGVTITGAGVTTMMEFLFRTRH